MVNFVIAAGRSLFRGWPIVMIIWFTSDRSIQAQAAYLEAMYLALFFVIMGLTGALRSVVHWLHFGYRIRDNRLEVRSGVFRKQTRGISPDRIQNIEQSQHLLHRIAGLTELRVETASGGEEVEVHLNALRDDEKQRLLAALDQLQTRQSTEEVSTPAWIVNGTTDLFWYATTGPRWGWIGLGLGLLFEVITVQDPTNPMPWAGLTNLAAPILVLGVVALITGIFVATIFSVVNTFHDYTLTKTPHTLIATSGLFTRRTVELPRKRIQSVIVFEPALRRLAGFATLSLETAAGDSSAERKNAEALIPVVDVAQVPSVCNTALPGAAVVGSPLRPAAPYALYRAFFRAGRNVLVLTLIAVAVGGSFGWLMLLLILPALIMAKWDHEAQGWMITEDVVISRRGWWSRTTVIIARSKIQSVHLSQGPFLRRVKLKQVTITAPGTAVTLPEIRQKDANELFERLQTASRRQHLAPQRALSPKPQEE